MMDTDTQEIIALALVALVIGFAIMRRLRKPAKNGCNSCESNPGNKNNQQKESTVRFMRKPGS